jgi:DUF917 family protein
MPDKTMHLTLDDLPALTLGAGILGTGGGGDPYIGLLSLRRQIELRGAPRIIPLESVADDDEVVTVGMAGSPAVALEKLMTESFADCWLERFQTMCGRRFSAVVPLEIGGVNSLMPLLTTCATGLPTIDADGMGRAFPSLDRTTFHIAGMSAYPLFIMNEHMEHVAVQASNTQCGDRIVRNALVELGGAVIGVMFPMTGRQVKDCAIPGTMTMARGIGQAVLTARAAKTDPFAAIIDYLASMEKPSFARVLFDGKIADVSRDMVGGFNIGQGLLEGSTGTARFAFQNEYLYVRGDDRLLAVVPDLICFLDAETAEPVTCELLRYGQRIKVLGAACAPQFRTQAGLAVAGPASFRLPDTYVPIEQLT